MSRAAPSRRTVDLAEHDDLVVIVLGMKVTSSRGLATLARIGRRIRESVEEGPEGLLHSEFSLRGIAPPHVEVRQYWRDFEALERFARTPPHSDWWQAFSRDRAGTAFWHETYAPGGIEAVYLGLDEPVGLQHVAPVEPASGSMFASRRRLGEDDNEPVVDHPIADDGEPVADKSEEGEDDA